MTPAESDDLRKWMEQRFDRIDDKLERETSALASEIVTTRHGLKPVIEQIAVQVAQEVVKTAENTRRIDSINAWRADDGPLDQRFHRHSSRLDAGEAWRNRFAGGLAVVMFLFPTTVGVILKYG